MMDRYEFLQSKSINIIRKRFYIFRKYRSSSSSLKRSHSLHLKMADFNLIQFLRQTDKLINIFLKLGLSPYIFSLFSSFQYSFLIIDGR